MSSINSIVRAMLPGPLQAIGEVFAKITGPAAEKKGPESGGTMGDAIARLRDQRMPAAGSPAAGMPVPFSVDARTQANVKSMLPEATAKLAEAERDKAGEAYSAMHKAMTQRDEAAIKLKGFTKISQVMDEAMQAYGRGDVAGAKRILQEAKDGLTMSDSRPVYGHGHAVFRELLEGIENGDFMKKLGKNQKFVNDLKINPQNDMVNAQKAIQSLHEVATKHMQLSTLVEQQQMRAGFR